MSDRLDKQKLKLVIDGYLRGDSTQFRIIKTKITQYVYHQKFGQDSDRDDIISEILEILYDNLKAGKFKGDSIAALNVYIYNTIRFRINRVIRRRARLSYTDETADFRPDSRPSPEEEAAAKDLAGKVMSALDPKCQDLLRLKFQECWSDQEIAEHIKKSKNATSTAISRCLGKAQNLDIVKESM